jgi:hypothetical protein
MNFIVGVFQLCCGLFFISVIAAGGILGYHFLGENGWLLGGPAGFLVASVVLGPLFLLMRIDDNIAALRRHSETVNRVKTSSERVTRSLFKPKEGRSYGTTPTITPRRFLFLVFISLVLTLYIVVVAMRVVFHNG